MLKEHVVVGQKVKVVGWLNSYAWAKEATATVTAIEKIGENCVCILFDAPSPHPKGAIHFSVAPKDLMVLEQPSGTEFSDRPATREELIKQLGIRHDHPDIDMAVAIAWSFDDLGFTMEQLQKIEARLREHLKRAKESGDLILFVSSRLETYNLRRRLDNMRRGLERVISEGDLTVLSSYQEEIVKNRHWPELLRSSPSPYFDRCRAVIAKAQDEGKI
jgi:hypothetical protein